MLYEVEVKCGLTLPVIIGSRFYGSKTYDDGSIVFGDQLNIKFIYTYTIC